MENNHNLADLENRILTYITPESISHFNELFSCNVPHPDIKNVISAATHILFNDCEDSWNGIRQRCGSASAFVGMIIRTQNEKVQIGEERLGKAEEILAHNPSLQNIKSVSIAGHLLLNWIKDYIQILKIRSRQDS
jgi:hypothetical protein